MAYNRRLRLCVLGSIKMVDHPWLWHGVLTKMVVLEDRPRIMEERYKAKSVTAFIYNIHYRRLQLHVSGSIKMVDHPWLWHGVLTRMI